jgi:hypothetical protein
VRERRCIKRIFILRRVNKACWDSDLGTQSYQEGLFLMKGQLMKIREMELMEWFWNIAYPTLWNTCLVVKTQLEEPV